MVIEPYRADADGPAQVRRVVEEWLPTGAIVERPLVCCLPELGGEVVRLRCGDLPDDGPTGGFFRDGRPLPW